MVQAVSAISLPSEDYAQPHNHNIHHTNDLDQLLALYSADKSRGRDTLSPSPCVSVFKKSNSLFLFFESWAYVILQIIRRG